MANVLFAVLMVVVVLGVLVFLHELGHYMAAKAFGIWVHRFAVGMGAPIKRLSFRRGETEWAIAWLPLGGYVKMASREEDPSSGVLEGGAENAIVPPDRVFEAKPIWQRMIVILAGVTVNMLFAWLVFSGLALKNGNAYDPTTTVGSVTAEALPAAARGLADVRPGTRVTAMNGRAIHTWDDVTAAITSGSRDTITFAFDGHPDVAVPLHRDQLIERSHLADAIRPMHPPVLGVIGVGSPAERAGLQVGDSIVAVQGDPVRYWPEVVARVEANAGRPVTVDVIRDGAPVELTVTPEAQHRDPSDTTTPMVGRIGVGQRVPVVHEPYSLVGALGAGSRATWFAAGTIVRTVRGLLTRRIASSEVGGPILIAQMAASSARLGIDALLAFMALISVNLAVVNLLPIPVLDGGAFLILAVEGIIRRPLPTRLREAIQVLGLVLIVGLMFLAFKNDIMRLLS